MDQQLSIDDIQLLRQKGLITDHEIAVRSGDLVIAVNVVTQERRIIDTQGLLLESTRQVLKG